MNIMKHRALSASLVFMVILIFFSCKRKDCCIPDIPNPYKNFSQEQLEKLSTDSYKKINELTTSIPCTDPTDWNMTDMRTECGLSHIVYHKSLDRTKLEQLIYNHNQIMEIYAPMVAPVINCMAYQKPSGIICQNGKATLIYNNTKN